MDWNVVSACDQGGPVTSATDTSTDAATARPFELVSSFKPTGDQPEAIERLVAGLESGMRAQTMLGATATGKTFTMANIIERWQRPALVLAPNRTLAAQLVTEFREFFPRNAVEYFVSYYDYYQPEAYLPRTDTYIAKDADINDEIDKMRHAATRALFEHRDVVIVASVSCIYGLGEPGEYQSFVVDLSKGRRINRNSLIRQLVEMQYDRNDVNLVRGTFRVRGDSLTVFPAYEELAVRVDFWGDEVERIVTIDPLSGELLGEADRTAIYPAKHFVTSAERMEQAIVGIDQELTEARIGAALGRPFAGGAAAGGADPLRPGDDEGDRLLRRRGELLAPPRRASSRLHAVDAAGLLPRRLAAVHGRIAHRRSAGPRYVRGRHLAQGHTGGVRLPSALGAGQPAAELR